MFMLIFKDVENLRNYREKLYEKVIGFVPTMGYLHKGHISLIKKAKEECDIVFLSIFVNPLQFSKGEDYEIYPRDFSRDSALAKDAGVDVLFFPSEKEIYQSPHLTKITVEKLTSKLCGKFRMGHFEGVALIIVKLFNMILPKKVYLGIKDAQQVAVIQQLITDLSFPVSLVICPTIREKDGLAFSSRNKYLLDEERKQAVVIPNTLNKVKEFLSSGMFLEKDELVSFIKAEIEKSPLAKIQYIEVLKFPSLENLTVLKGVIIIALAVYFGKTRLIDNLIFDLDKKEPCFII